MSWGLARRRVYVPHSLMSQPGQAWVEPDFGRTTLPISSSKPAAHNANHKEMHLDNLIEIKMIWYDMTLNSPQEVTGEWLQPNIM